MGRACPDVSRGGSPRTARTAVGLRYPRTDPPDPECFGFTTTTHLPGAAPSRRAPMALPRRASSRSSSSHWIALGTRSKARAVGSPTICPKRFSAGGEEAPRVIAREAGPPKVLAAVPEVPVGRLWSDWINWRNSSTLGRVQGTSARRGGRRPSTPHDCQPTQAYFSRRRLESRQAPAASTGATSGSRSSRGSGKGRLYEALGSRLYVVMQDVLVQYRKDHLGLRNTPGRGAQLSSMPPPSSEDPGPGYELSWRVVFNDDATVSSEPWATVVPSRLKSRGWGRTPSA